MANASDRRRERTRAKLQGKKPSFGLLANGSCGPWDIAVDETTTGTDRWTMQIDGPTVTFHFEIPSVEIVGKLIQFLKARHVAEKASSNGSMKSNGLIVIGKDKKTPIAVVRDDEYKDRFFLLVGPMGDPKARFVIAGEDLGNIVAALKQVKQDLDDDLEK